MTPIRFSPTSLREGRWYEYVIRFALGGAATVFTGVISSRYGAAVGGLFLALPAIFCASATLIEKHEIRRKRDVGLDGQRRGQEAAALEAAGAALGAIGMLAFAVVFWLLVESSVVAAFAAPRWPGSSSRLQPGSRGARCGLCGGRVERKNLAAPPLSEAATVNPTSRIKPAALSHLNGSLRRHLFMKHLGTASQRPARTAKVTQAV